MLTTLKIWVGTIKTTFTNLGALAVFAITYALLLAALYLFVTTREATVSQVLITYLLMVLIPALFFVLQATIIDRVRDGKFQWRLILIDALKFFVMTIPILLIAWLLYYLLNKWQLRYPPPALPSLPITSGPPKPQSFHLPSVIFATLRFVLFGVALPLAAIHLWIAVAGGEVRALFASGATSFFKRIGAALARAFASDSVLIYALGLLIFVGVPYAALFVPLSVKGNKTDFAIFILRLVIVFVFSLIGWLVTISALVRNYEAGAPVVSPDPVPVPMEMVA
jgi:hypothetical protein